MRLVRPILFTLTLVLTAGLLACSGGKGTKLKPGEEGSKVPAEAYLFDAKIIRNGKQNSLRLEIYQTDTVLGLNGRAYLGKGALRGKVTADSLAVYLPVSNEFVYESIAEALTATDCGIGGLKLNLIQFFRTLPDSITIDPRITVAANRQDDRRPRFLIFIQNCPWQMELTYDRQSTGWRIVEFTFSNGKNLTLSATRREYKAGARVKSERLRFSHPDSAERITL